MAIIEAYNLSKRYPNGYLAVDNISLRVEEGSITTLMGPNGSGKTTTLNMLTGSLRPSSGQISICGYNLWGDRRQAVLARMCLGYAPQDMPFRGKLSALENLIWFGLIRGLSPGKAKNRALEVLDQVELSEYAKHRVDKLSGGQRRRLAIAAALVGNPRILVLDEPTSGLDPAARERLWRLLRELSRDKTILLSTHIAEEAERHSDYVYIFHRGRIAAEGSPRALITRYARKSSIRVKLASSPVKNLMLKWKYYRQDRELTIIVDDPSSELPKIVETLLQQGLVLESIEVIRPGLEQVFLEVTGELLHGTASVSEVT